MHACGVLFPGDDDASREYQKDEAQASASVVLLFVNLASSVPQLLVAGTGGALADRWGRKGALLCAVAGLLASNATLLAVVVDESLPLCASLVAGSAVGGCLGGSALFAAAFMARLSDLTSSATEPLRRLRARAFVIAQVALMLGVVCGPVSGGVVTAKFGHATTAGVSVALAALAGALILCFAETLPATVGGEGGKGGGGGDGGGEGFSHWWRSSSLRLLWGFVRGDGDGPLPAALRPVALAFFMVCTQAANSTVTILFAQHAFGLSAQVRR